MLGLLALMISFTFAMALSRYEARREGVIAEANAIGTTALRARLLTPPHNSECLALLRDYVQVRLKIAQDVPSKSDLKSAIEKSNGLQEALWRQAISMVSTSTNNALITNLFVQSLNQMIDLQAMRLAAGRNRVPNMLVAHKQKRRLQPL